MLKTLLLGRSGFLGSYFAEELRNSDSDTAPKLKYLKDDSSNCPRFTKETEIQEYLDGVDYDLIINCIALANIEKCEANPSLAKWLNRDLPLSIAQHVSLKGKKLVHFSTDAIYSNENHLRTEDSAHIPASVYARTKLAGEEGVSKNCINHYTFRVNFFGNNPRGSSLFNYLISNLQSSKPIQGFTDNFFNPMYAGDLVSVVLRNLSTLDYGTYNLGGNAHLSKFDFAIEVAKVFGMNPDLVQSNTLQSRNTGNLRTLNLAMNTGKIESRGIVLPSVTSGLRQLQKAMGV
jgi:dTDP-4-dehydrorhamnose reductase